MSAAMRNGKRCIESLYLVEFNIKGIPSANNILYFQEDPGESLSDCDKDEEECPEECSKSDGESEDGFFVPDGYLSEDEVEVWCFYCNEFKFVVTMFCFSDCK